MNWVEITITTSPQAVEAIANILLECHTGGVAEDLVHPGAVRLRGYLPVGPAVDITLAAIRRRIQALPQFHLDITPGTVETAVIEDTDWAASWKTHYKGFHVGRTLWIKPTWEPGAPANTVVIALDPGMAFGSGLHPSTQMCLVALEDSLQVDATVFDVGTGSGILAIAAAKLGAKAVLAVDADPVAVDVARENVAYNQVADRVQVRPGDLLRDVEGFAEIVTANLTADLHLEFVPTVPTRLKPGGLLIASGIVADRLLEVQAVATASGFRKERLQRDGEWRCLVLEGPAAKAAL